MQLAQFVTVFICSLFGHFTNEAVLWWSVWALSSQFIFVNNNITLALCATCGMPADSSARKTYIYWCIDTRWMRKWTKRDTHEASHSSLIRDCVFELVLVSTTRICPNVRYSWIASSDLVPAHFFERFSITHAIGQGRTIFFVSAFAVLVAPLDLSLSLSQFLFESKILAVRPHPTVVHVSQSTYQFFYSQSLNRYSRLFLVSGIPRFSYCKSTPSVSDCARNALLLMLCVLRVIDQHPKWVSQSQRFIRMCILSSVTTQNLWIFCAFFLIVETCLVILLCARFCMFFFSFLLLCLNIRWPRRRKQQQHRPP